MKKLIAALAASALMASSAVAADAVRPGSSLPQANAVGGSSLTVRAGTRAGPPMKGENDLFGSTATGVLFVVIIAGITYVIYKIIDESGEDLPDPVSP